jgi:hypothetical protein
MHLEGKGRYCKKKRPTSNKKTTPISISAQMNSQKINVGP